MLQTFVEELNQILITKEIKDVFSTDELIHWSTQ